MLVSQCLAIINLAISSCVLLLIQLDIGYIAVGSLYALSIKENHYAIKAVKVIKGDVAIDMLDKVMQELMLDEILKQLQL